MRKFGLRTLTVALPSMLLGSLLTASLTTTAKAGPQQSPSPYRHDEWEYRDYRTKDSDVAYGELNKLGSEGWEAYAYAVGTSGTFNWELKRRK